MNLKALSLIACLILTAGLASCGGDEGSSGPSPAPDTKKETPEAGSKASPAASPSPKATTSPAASPSPAAGSKASPSPAAKKASPAPTKTP